MGVGVTGETGSRKRRVRGFGYRKGRWGRGATPAVSSPQVFSLHRVIVLYRTYIPGDLAIPFTLKYTIYSL